jgi:hypothetical protein
VGGVGRPSGVPAPRTGQRLGLPGYALLATLGLAVGYLTGPTVGTAFGPGVLVTLLVGALAARLWPARTQALVALTGVVVLAQWVGQRYFVLHLGLVGGAYLLRRRPRLLAGFLIVGGVVLPKELFRLFYHWTFLHDWLNPYLLAHLLLMTAYWWQARRRGKATEDGPAAWGALFLFPSHPMNPMAFAPDDVWRARAADVRAVTTTAALLAAKAGVLLLLAWAAPRGRLMDQSAAELLARPLPLLWLSVLHSYLHVVLTLSGAADVAVLIARVFGWHLPHHFRFALLAWNPVELWRRWAIYNRRLLLALVYFPLGGGQRHRYLNVLATFLASGLLLHSGWLGSKYWELGLGGLRDETVYFLLQGLAVCACLALWQRQGKDPRSDRELRWSWGRAAATIATQALSAWLHILVVAPQVDWAERWRLMGRCLGL